MPTRPPLPDSQLEAICKVLASTSGGLTGSQIADLLRMRGLEDPAASMAKWRRLHAALARKQAADGSANHVLAFVQEAMDPVRFHEDPNKFAELRSDLNQVLAFAGLGLGEDGRLMQTSAVSTLSDAQKRATRLRTELQRRKVHGDVLRFCRAELLKEDYFHAVFEATKSVAEKLRTLSGMTSDGGELVDQALGLGKSGVPRIAFNSLRTPTEESEHKGLANLLRGMFGAFRNVTAHAPRVTWHIGEDDALDLLTLASLLHRRLDAAVATLHCP